MKILIFGATSFIGKNVIKSLQNIHQLVLPNRHEVNFGQPNQIDPAKIAALMQGVDVVINSVGVLNPDETLMENIHHHTPIMLARIAKKCGVKRWINLSALGANPLHPVAFVGSKGRGDKAILELADDDFFVAVARPSLVFGRGGESSEMFIKLARLPVLCLPDTKNIKVQPVHVMDVAAGLTKLAIEPYTKTQAENSKNAIIIDFTGRTACTFPEYLNALRQNIWKKTAARIIPIPISLIRLFLPIAGLLSKGVLNKDSLNLLLEDNTADNAAFADLLGYPIKSYNEFMGELSKNKSLETFARTSQSSLTITQTKKVIE